MSGGLEGNEEVLLRDRRDSQSYTPAFVDQLDKGKTCILLDGVLPLLQTNTKNNDWLLTTVINNDIKSSHEGKRVHLQRCQSGKHSNKNISLHVLASL